LGNLIKELGIPSPVNKEGLKNQLMSTSLKVLYFVYKAKTNSKGLAPIIFRLKYNKQVAQLSTGYFIKPKDWNKDKSQVRTTDVNYMIINKHLKDLELKSYSIFSNMFHEGNVNLNSIIAQLKGLEEGPVTLLQLVKICNVRIKERVGIDLQVTTYKKYLITESKINEFIKFLGKQDIRLKELKQNFIEDFSFFMKQKYNNEPNTCGKHLKNLKQYLRFAVNMEWLTKSPFAEFKVSYKVKEKPYLNIDELKLLERKTFVINRLQLVRNLFLIQCYTGLSFIDLSELKCSDVTTGIDGNQWIIKNRVKTDIRSAIPLLPKALSLIVEFNPKYKELDSEPLLPLYSLQKYNSYLKEVAELSGINKELTSHAGRRTFASTVALTNGISIESIAQMLGHSSTKITHQYARVSDLKVACEMDKIRELYKD
jgi:site-specific recombinase XerD